jgi:uncharacterized surface protein with fasciclin (FAS1) repeats
MPMKKVLFLISTAILLVACEDKWEKYENNPDFMGESIYNYLADNGSFTTYIRLIDDLGYTDVLSKTGSKTLFVADDAAFERFYTGNTWGVRRYEDFSLSQKKLIFNSSILNNAMLVENLSTVQGPVTGQALRQETALSVTDSIPFEKGDALPATIYWERFREQGVHLAKDNTPIPMLLFLDAQMRAKGITDEDFSLIFNGKQREKNDAYMYNVRVKERDIVCQNGYIHVIEDVLVPPSNMAEVIRTSPETKQFGSFLERFAVPYYSAPLTQQYALLGGQDSVFVKAYFAQRGGGSVRYNSANKTVTAPDGSNVSSFLSFDPGWNRYNPDEYTSFQTDMAVIFAPSDEALEYYFTQGSGRVLRDRYGSIENIPNTVLDKLVKNHAKPSFLAALPSRFATIVDDAQEKMGVEKSHVEKVYLASNGVVYVTNTVYLPALYSSVMLPASINENMKVFNWAIDQLEFDAYLLSMVNYYSFILPEDNFTYIVPTSLKHAQPEAWKFHFNDINKSVYASVHPYDAISCTTGDSTAVLTNAATLKDHLEDMLDYHIIVGNIEDGKEYYRTKGGGTIRIAGTGAGMQLAGGGDIERNVSIWVKEIYDQTKETNGRGNGKTYIVNQPVQTPTRSVYSVLSQTSEFSEFFQLLQGDDGLWLGDANRMARFSIFEMPTQAGLDFNVRFLNTFHYTLYVPTNFAVRRAIQNGLPTWDNVKAATNQEQRDALAEKIIRFLRYHFQDNSVYLDKTAISASYETAALNIQNETFYKLNLSGGNYQLNINTEAGGTARVETEGGLFNIMARDFKFNTSNPATATTIETSSYVVMHQIDNCLYFE